MFKNKYVIISLIVIFLLIVGGATAYQWYKGSKVVAFKPATLEFWGVWEDPDVIKDVISSYRSRHPQVTINYRSFRPEEYSQKLLEAWALDKGPDIFMIPNASVRQYLAYSTPMPVSMQVPTQRIEGTVKKQTINEMTTYTGYTSKNIKDTFLPVVYDDVVIDNQIYALPFSVDTMALFYNRDLLQKSDLAEPATTWDEIVTQVGKISRRNEEDQLIQSGIALGTTNNIPNAFDIISLLMMQIGVPMENQGTVAFAKNPDSLTALRFFGGFAQPTTAVYSWNVEMGDALDMFTAGKLAYFLGYNYNVQQIKDANPKLDWDVVPVPQAQGSENPVTYANYWVAAVANKSKSKGVAWQFIQEMTNKNNVLDYLTATKKTTALRSLIKEQESDPTLGAFVSNLLQAKSWYHGYNFTLAQKYFLTMVNNLQTAEDSKIKNLLSEAERQIQQTYAKPIQEN